MSKAARSALGLPFDICEGVEPPRVEPNEDNVLRADELGRVMAVIEAKWPQHYAAILVIASTGLRWGEASALKWTDIDDVNGLIRVVRGNWKGKEVTSTRPADVGRCRLIRP